MIAPKNSEFFDSHPILYRLVAFCLTIVLVGLITYALAHQRGEFRQPEVHLESQVEDTGIYLSREESLFDGSGKLNCYGKHIVLVTRLKPLDADDGKFEHNYGEHWYGPARDFKDSDRTYVLRSGEELPKADLDTYLEVDGIVSGYLLQPGGGGTDLVDVRHPILEISSIRRGALIDLVSPATHEVSPQQSVGDSGVTFTLDAITYHDALVVAQVVVTNESERYVNAKGMTVTCDDGRPVYSNDNAFKYGSYFGDDSSDGLTHFESAPLVEPGASLTMTCPLDPIDPHESLRFAIELNTTDGIIRDGKLEWDTRELVIAYRPEVAE